MKSRLQDPVALGLKNGFYEQGAVYMKMIILAAVVLFSVTSFAKAETRDLKKCITEGSRAVSAIAPFSMHLEKLTNEMVQANQEWIRTGDERYQVLLKKLGAELQSLNADIVHLTYKSCVAIQ